MNIPEPELIRARIEREHADQENAILAFCINKLESATDEKLIRIDTHGAPAIVIDRVVERLNAARWLAEHWEGSQKDPCSEILIRFP